MIDDGKALVGGALTVLLGLIYAFREWISRRESPSAGWKVAVAEVKETQAAQAAEIETLRAQVAALTTERAAQAGVIAQQQKTLDAQSGRIVQLLTAWPEGSEPPSPSPAHAPYL